MTVTRPNFSVAADETTWRRLGAVIREKVYRLSRSSYTLGIQSQSGLVDAQQVQAMLDEKRNEIGRDLEALLMLIDMMAEMKDVNVNNKLTPTRRSRSKKAEPAPQEESWESAPETTGVPSPNAPKDAATAKTDAVPDAPSPEQSSALESATNLAAYPHHEMTTTELVSALLEG